MFALARTLVGLLLASIISRLVIVLSRFHQLTPQRLVSRRAFLRNAVLGSVGVVTALSAGSFVAFFWNNKTGAFGGEIPVPLDLVPPVGEAPYRNQGGKFYIINNEDAALAIYWKCVHLGCTVPWVEGQGQFICPCHGSVYDPNGVRIAGPAPRPLDFMGVTVDASGNLTVNTGDIRTRGDYSPDQATPITA